MCLDTHVPSMIGNAWKLLKCGSWHCVGIAHTTQSVFTAASSQQCLLNQSIQTPDIRFQPSTRQVGAEVAHSAHSDRPCGGHPLPCGVPQALPRTAQAPFSSAQRYLIRLDPSGSLPSYRRSPPGHSPQRPLEAGWALLTHAQDRHGQGFSTLFFLHQEMPPKGRLVPSLVPSISSETALPLPLWARNRWAWHVRVRLRLDRSGRGWSTKTRATHELAMPLFSFPRILRFERHAVLRPLLRASSQVQLQHLAAG